ncbi:hypothetical protein IWX49DRAFT_95832 [Phyllosticta citricarpa]|uniref:Uncharacterized protein n=2 Tax=Phyllosticta TaxID=121621 RepID=A0ABR1NFQ1_9PEZI
MEDEEKQASEVIRFGSGFAPNKLVNGFKKTVCLSFASELFTTFSPVLDLVLLLFSTIHSGKMSDSDNPLGPTKHGESKSCLQETILEEISRRLPRQPVIAGQASSGGSGGIFRDHSNLPPLIIVGNVQHLSLGTSLPSAVQATDAHHQPPHAAYFSGSRNVSITGGISRSTHHCGQGNGQPNTEGGTLPRNTDRVGDGSITVVDGEVHNPTAHLQSMRYFDGAHHFSIAGGAVMRSHQPVTHAPGEEPTFPTPSVCHEDPQAQLDTPAVVQNANASAVPSAHGSPALPPESAQNQRTPPARQSPALNLVTPSPYRPCWENSAAETLLHTGSDAGVGRSGATVESPSPSPRPSESASHPYSGREGKARYRLRAPGRAWLFGRRTKKRQSDEEE